MIVGTSDGRAFRSALVNDTVRVLVAVDLSGVSPEKLGSYNAQLNWTTTALRYVRSENVAGGFVAPTLNETQTGSGQLRFGAVVGSDGFGFAPKPDGTYQKIPQTAPVVIEDDVEIGANTTIDRAALGVTWLDGALARLERELA